MVNKNQLSSPNRVTLENFLDEYLYLNIKGTVIPCPYWMNKIKHGQVIFRGFLNGKGAAKDIRQKLIEVVDIHNQKIDNIKLIKIARRNRVGIDCSGFVYRLINHLVKHKFNGCKISDLSEIFKEGINKTNSDMLTSPKYATPVSDLTKVQIGDLIRMKGGHHLAIVIECDTKTITYAHSSSFAAAHPGVHLGKITITDKTKSLVYQIWDEKLKDGASFQEKYFKPKQGDKIVRLNIFNQ